MTTILHENNQDIFIHFLFDESFIKLHKLCKRFWALYLAETQYVNVMVVQWVYSSVVFILLNKVCIQKYKEHHRVPWAIYPRNTISCCNCARNAIGGWTCARNAIGGWTRARNAICGWISNPDCQVSTVYRVNLPMNRLGFRIYNHNSLIFTCRGNNPLSTDE